MKELCGQFHSVCGVNISPAQAKKYLDEGTARRLIRGTKVYFDGRPSETLFSLESEPQWPPP